MGIRKSKCGVTLLYNRFIKAKTCFHRVYDIINTQQNKITRVKLTYGWWDSETESHTEVQASLKPTT